MTCKKTPVFLIQREKSKQLIQVPFCTILTVKNCYSENVLSINSKLGLTASCRNIKCNINLSVSKALIHRQDSHKDQKSQKLGNLWSVCELVSEYGACSKFTSPFYKVIIDMI